MRAHRVAMNTRNKTIPSANAAKFLLTIKMTKTQMTINPLTHNHAATEARKAEQPF